MSESILPTSPFKGLVPYTEEDAPFFFGRDPEIEIITANLMASRLTLVYGPSGVGKSSVLRAGVEYRLRQQMQQDLQAGRAPETCVVVFPGPGAGHKKGAGTWRGDPVAMIEERIYETLATLPTQGQDQVVFPDDPPNHFPEFLEAWTKRCNTELVIILDQFEEYFLYHGQEAGSHALSIQFPRALNRQDLRVNFLISIREDAVAKLDLFKGRIPNLFENYLRIDHLDRESARAAIEKPIEKYNRLRSSDHQAIGIEPALVEEVLKELKTGKVVLGGAGRGIVTAETGESSEFDRIETPYLQLVMTRLWEEERRAVSPILRLDTLRRLGGSARIVRTHLDTVMGSFSQDEQRIAASVFNFLVTPSGTKIAHSVADLAAYAQVQELPPLASLLERLCLADSRILRELAPPPGQPQVTRYEIFHDVLAAPILDWRVRYQAGKKLAEEKVLAEKKLAEAAKQLAWMPWVIGYIIDLFACLPIGLWFTLWRLKKKGVSLDRRRGFGIAIFWILGSLIGWTFYILIIGGAQKLIDSDDIVVPFIIFVYLFQTLGGPFTGWLRFRWLTQSGKLRDHV